MRRCRGGGAAAGVWGAIGLVAAFGVDAPAPARAVGDAVIAIEYVEFHDRLDPDPKANITARHQIVATLAADSHVSERTETLVGRGKRVFARQEENSGSLGDNSAWAVWRVLGPHKLERLFAGHGFLLKIDVDVGPGDACSVQVNYLLQNGFTAVMTRRADTGQPARVSLPKVVSAQCSIQ